MTRTQLFLRLCRVADALQAEIACGRVSRRTLALHAILGQLDALIDEVVDHPIVEGDQALACLLEGPAANDEA
jgi:hypothetical protein